MDENVNNNPVRIQKLLANAGLGSRRQIEELISKKRITINSKVAVLGDRASEMDDIAIDGHKVDLQNSYVTYLLNKPVGVISSSSDEYGRKTVVDLIVTQQRIYPIGRLDADTSGLILVSNDGDLTYKLTHPKHGVEKTYIATVEGEISQNAIEALKSGIELDDGITAPSKVRELAKKDGQSLIEVVIHEGRNRQIRRMLESVGFPVITLTRTKIGNLEDKNLLAGQYREVTLSEIQMLKMLANSENIS